MQVWAADILFQEQGLVPEHGPQRRPREAKQRFQHNGPMTSLLTKSRRNNGNSKSGSHEWSHLVGSTAFSVSLEKCSQGEQWNFPPFLALCLPQLLTDGKWVLVNQLTDGRWTVYLVPILHLSLLLTSPGSQQLRGGWPLPKSGNVFVVWVPECPSPVL